MKTSEDTYLTHIILDTVVFKFCVQLTLPDKRGKLFNVSGNNNVLPSFRVRQTSLSVQEQLTSNWTVLR